MKAPKSRDNNRSCGDCKACCTTCAVLELSKPLNMTCQHVSEHGCAIYETRPQSCRVYDCAWLQGHLPEKYRPDQSGIVWTYEQVPGRPVRLAHAMLVRDGVPLERIEYLFKMLQHGSSHKLTLWIVPHSLHARAHKNIAANPIKPGVYVAVGESQDEG